jgi:hypothetical protein
VGLSISLVTQNKHTLSLLSVLSGPLLSPAGLVRTGPPSARLCPLLPRNLRPRGYDRLAIHNQVFRLFRVSTARVHRLGLLIVSETLHSVHKSGFSVRLPLRREPQKNILPRKNQEQILRRTGRSYVGSAGPLFLLHSIQAQPNRLRNEQAGEVELFASCAGQPHLPWRWRILAFLMRHTQQKLLN